ncbi:MAG: 50S ribosomal protein L10 [Candidatus Eisenbacteria bacterium]
MPTPKKEAAVATLKKKLEGAQAVVLADFTGLTVERINELRRQFYKNDAEFYVIKNTLGRIAVRETDMEGLTKYFEGGPTGWAVTSSDPTIPAKVLTEFAKIHKLPALKGGYIDGAVLNAEQIQRVAELPAKPVLVAQVLGLLNAPITGVAGAVNAVMTYLAVAVDEIRKQKEAGSQAA